MLTAKEMRKLSDEFAPQVDAIVQKILEECRVVALKVGSTSLYYNMSPSDGEKTISEVENTLIKLGYTVRRSTVNTRAIVVEW